LQFEKIYNRFNLYGEKEDPKILHDSIEGAVAFRGTNLWILIFAIMVACLGLNMNSTAVIIGAMLISPLMGPIMGIGYSTAINDLPLLKKSLVNYGFAALVGFVASAIYFFVSPLHENNSELLARTYPTLYDVLIALFGGLAGIVAASSKQKGNVIPGVAIATALMPPLCTAGFGLATKQYDFVLGALYLYLINSVFIALATFLTTRFLNFPYRDVPEESEAKRSRFWITLVTVLTIIPSIYFAYDIISRERFNKNAENFMKNESKIPNNIIIKSNIEPKDERIEISYVGKPISDSEITNLKGRLKIYGLEETELEINQGLSFLQDEEDDRKKDIVEMDKSTFQEIELTLDSIAKERQLSLEVYKELKALYPKINNAYIQASTFITDSTSTEEGFLVYLDVEGQIPQSKKDELMAFLKVRMDQNQVKLVIE